MMTPDMLNSERNSDGHPAGEVVTACMGQSERLVGADRRYSSDGSHTTSQTEENVADVSHCKADETQTVTSDRGNYLCYNIAVAK